MESPIKQLIVLDELRDRMEMIDSDIIPESFSQPVQEGTQNVAANIYSVNGTSYAGNYTTLPLSPLTGNVHMVDKSFIHTQFTLNFSIIVKNNSDATYAKNTAGSKLRLFVGPRDTASLFSRLQLLMGNDQIFSTDYQQLESAIGLASLPSDVVEHCQQYATIDKLLSHKNTPMQLVELDLTGLTNGAQKTFNITLNYDLTIDLNRLAIPLSDIHFITRNMGMLNLRLFFNNMHQSFFYFVVPDGFTSVNNQGCSAITQLAPIQWGTAMNIDAPGAAATIAGVTGSSAPYSDTPAPITNQITFYTQFYNPAGTAPVTGTMFFTLEKIAICQSCFEIEHESYEKLEEFFKDNGNKCIIPIHVLNTTLFSNGSISGVTSGQISYPTTLNAQVSNQNISKLFVSQFLANNQTAILNPMFSDFTLYYNGKPVNALPYQKINDRAIADFTSTMLDTDSQEVNNDYLYSLSFGQQAALTTNIQDQASTLSNVDGSKYFSDAGYINKLRAWKGYNGWSDTSFKISHLCPLAFSTGVEGSFQTGLCVDYGAGTGTQQARLVAANPYNDTTWNGNLVNSYTIPNAKTNSTNIALSAYTDACLVLSFDPYRHYCVNGILSYVKPFIRAEI